VWRTIGHHHATLVVHRFSNNPIIRPEMLPAGDGDNINGASLIRAPAWLPGRLGEYYLYFAHHRGQYIRLAYAEGAVYAVSPAGRMRESALSE